MDELINEILDDWLRWAWDTDDERETLAETVKNWLLGGNNDGSKASVLAARFDADIAESKR